MNHWMILPILLPAIVAPLLALAVRHDQVLARTFSVGSTCILLVISLYQLAVASDGVTRTYELGDWPAPFGIVLVLDRLAALMLVLTAVLAICVLLYAINGWDKRGQHFHPLFQFQLMGINGAFLTGDLFNLFVFFELLLIASYGLMLHGGGPARSRAGLQYMTINLLGSTIFLLALGLIYSVTGTLNMADFATKVPQVQQADQAMLYCGITLLLVVFCVKAALFPLHFWLPGTYTQTSPPVAALFAIMTKIGVYALVRISLLGLVSSSAVYVGWLTAALMLAASVTLVVGMIGVFSARSLLQQASFAALGSMGTLLLSIGPLTTTSISAALYYLISSTIGIAALFLLIDMVISRRPGEGDALTAAPPFAQQGLLAALFLTIAITVTGVPPFSGFVGKLLILQSLRSIPVGMWLWGVILITSWIGIMGFASSGSQLFWKSHAIEGSLRSTKPLPLALPTVSIGIMIGCIVFQTILSAPLIRYLDATTGQLFQPQQYIDAVLDPIDETKV